MELVFRTFMKTTPNKLLQHHLKILMAKNNFWNLELFGLKRPSRNVVSFLSESVRNSFSWSFSIQKQFKLGPLNKTTLFQFLLMQDYLTWLFNNTDYSLNA